MRSQISYIFIFGVSFVFLGWGILSAAQILTPQMQSLMNTFLATAQKQDAGIKAFSADEGKRLFNSKRMHSIAKEERSCTTCHTTNPTSQGKTKANKVIEPMAPSVNKERLTDPVKVEKWFKRNCLWVLERECTPKEKGDFITFMMTL